MWMVVTVELTVVRFEIKSYLIRGEVLQRYEFMVHVSLFCLRSVGGAARGLAAARWEAFF